MGLDSQDDAEIAQHGFLFAQGPGHEPEKLAGRGRILFPAHQAARARPDRVHTEKAGLGRGFLVDAEDVLFGARRRVQGDVLAPAPLEIQPVFRGIAPEVIEQGLVRRVRARKVRLGELTPSASLIMAHSRSSKGERSMGLRL